MKTLPKHKLDSRDILEGPRQTEGGWRCSRCATKKHTKRWKLAEGSVFHCGLCKNSWKQVYTNLKNNLRRPS